MSATVNGHALECGWFEMEPCDCGYDDVWDPFVSEDVIWQPAKPGDTPGQLTPQLAEGATT